MNLINDINELTESNTGTSRFSGIFGRKIRPNPAFKRSTDFIRIVFLDLRNILIIPIKFIALLWEKLVYVFNIISGPTWFYIPRIFWLIAFVGILYVMQLFWPLVIRIITLVIVPYINIVIEIYNFIFAITILILRIIFQIWNMLVPFIGMILYFIIDIFVTIMRDIFEILGSEAFSGIIQSLMEILFVLVDISMQVLMITIQVRISLLQAFAEIIGFLLEVIFDVVEVLFDIVIWLFEILFVILEPILFIIQAIAAIFTWMLASSATFSSRKLLSLGLATMTLSGSFMIPPDQQPNFSNQETSYKDFTDDILTSQSYLYKQYQNHINSNETSRLWKNNYHYNEVENNGRDLYKEYLDEYRHNSNPNKFSTNRKLFENQDNDNLDDIAHTMAHHFHRGVKKMVQSGTDFDLMHNTMARIQAFLKRKDRLSMKSLWNKFRKTNPKLAKLPKGPSSVRYSDVPEHPRDMHVRFHEYRKSYSERHGIPLRRRYNHKGRVLLDLNSNNNNQWDNSKNIHSKHLSKLELDHAKQIKQQEKEFIDFHMKRMKMAHVIHHSARTNILKHAQSTFHFDNIFTHWDNVLKRNGWHSIWDVYNEFIDTHGEASAFVMSLSAVSEHPVMKFLKLRDPDHHKGLFFIDWSKQQEFAKQYYKNSQQGSTSRKLLQQNNADRDVSGGNSKESFSGFEIISKTDCFSEPKNPLCMPVIPPEFGFEIPKISWPEEIGEDDECSPWRKTGCFICLDRFHNTFQSIRFMISGVVPPLNYLLTTFTCIVPWLSWTVNWVFLVPKGCPPSLMTWLCFIMHIYDVVIVGIAIWFILFFIVPFIRVLIIMPIIACRKTTKTASSLGIPENDEEYEKELEELWTTMTIRNKKRYNRGGDWRPLALRLPNTIYTGYGGAGQPRISSKLNEKPTDECIRLMGKYASAGTKQLLIKQRIFALLKYINKNEFNLHDNFDVNHSNSVRDFLTANHPLLLTDVEDHNNSNTNNASSSSSSSLTQFANLNLNIQSSDFKI